MALPVLNDTPKYELKIPSTGKKIKFRPYLVKEEKVLMMAAESGDGVQMMSAIMDTIQSCVQSQTKVESLTTFDIEYLFIKLRSKSVGESSTINLSCESCKEPNEHVIDLESIECVGGTKDKLIKISDEVTVEMKYPSYKDINLNQDENEMGFDILANSMSAVLTEEDRIEMADETPENIRKFLESMTKEQFEKVSTFLLDMPQVKHKIVYDCVKCHEPNEIELKGIQSFF
jgi:hypothetical protein